MLQETFLPSRLAHAITVCTLITSLHPPVYAHSGVLGVGILPEYLGQGIGKEIILTEFAGAKEIGLTRVELTVRENNKLAIQFYVKIGLVFEGMKRKAVRINNEYENLLCYAILFE